MQDQQSEQLLQLLRMAQSNSSTAAEIILSLVPLLGIIFGATLIFFFLLWNYRIKKEMVRTNQFKPTTVSNLRMFSLLVGLMSLFVGFPITFLFIAIEGITYAALGGLIPLFTGVGLLVFYTISKKQDT